MKIYALIRYDWIDYQEFLSIHEDQQFLVDRALIESKEDEYGYRIETWEDGKMVGGWRFFSYGKEFTQEIFQAVTSNYEN